MSVSAHSCEVDVSKHRSQRYHLESGRFDAHITTVTIFAGLGVAAVQSQPLSAIQRRARVGLVFQFPERHFLGAELRQVVVTFMVLYLWDM